MKKYNPIILSSYTFTPKDSLLIDANVWYLLYGPYAKKDRRVDLYSAAIKEIIAAKSKIYIDVLIISEFINRYARDKSKIIANFQKSSEKFEFKNFRNSSAFKPIAKEIASLVGRMLKHCNRLESDFVRAPINEILKDYASGVFDFNDQILSSLCQYNHLTLVTDDADFKNFDIPVLTENKKLLKNQ